MYGVQAVFGRMLFAYEIYAINASRNVHNAYMSRSASENWAKWSEDHPREAELLIEIEKIIDEE